MPGTTPTARVRRMTSLDRLGDSSLVRRIAAAPHLQAAGEARARVNDWLVEIAAVPAGKTLIRLSAAHPTLDALITGLAGGSPYLWDLVRGSPERFVALLEAEPERRFCNVLADAKRTIAATCDEAEVMRLLRRMKAEAAVGAAVDYLLVDAQRRGKLEAFEPGRPGRGSGYIVLAMGKMGAGELNYSSDVDLIVFYYPAAFAAGTEPAAFYVRVTRMLVKLLQERTPDGYVFRTDLRLRPDPASTQIAISTTAALDYYESRGQNWERAALIKARPCAGDVAAGEAFLAGLAPFIWRKYLDFAAVADVHAMKRQIHAYRGHDEIAVEGHNIKLGRGGIR